MEDWVTEAETVMSQESDELNQLIANHKVRHKERVCFCSIVCFFVWIFVICLFVYLLESLFVL